MKIDLRGWVKPSVDIPQDDPKFLHESIVVDVLLEDGTIVDGFYDNLHQQWNCIGASCSKLDEKKILGWRTKGRYEWDTSTTER